jgi:hypothetical protein
MVEPGDLKQLPDQAGQAADSEFATFIPQLLGNPYDCTKPHAAHVLEIAQVHDDAGKPIGDAGLALVFEMNGVFGVHPAGDVQHNLISNLGPFDGHDTPRVPYSDPSVNNIEVHSRVKRTEIF